MCSENFNEVKKIGGIVYREDFSRDAREEVFSRNVRKDYFLATYATNIFAQRTQSLFLRNERKVGGERNEDFFALICHRNGVRRNIPGFSINSFVLWFLSFY